MAATTQVRLLVGTCYMLQPQICLAYGERWPRCIFTCRRAKNMHRGASKLFCPRASRCVLDATGGIIIGCLWEHLEASRSTSGLFPHRNKERRLTKWVAVRPPFFMLSLYLYRKSVATGSLSLCEALRRGTKQYKPTNKMALNNCCAVGSFVFKT